MHKLHGRLERKSVITPDLNQNRFKFWPKVRGLGFFAGCKRDPLTKLMPPLLWFIFVVIVVRTRLVVDNPMRSDTDVRCR